MSIVTRASSCSWTRRCIAMSGVGVIAIAGLGTGSAVVLRAGTRLPSPTVASYDYSQALVGTSGFGPMTGGGLGSAGWTMGRAAYSSIMGGATAPACVRGQSLPGAMVSGSADPGTLMGRLFAHPPGARVSPTAATRLENDVPAEATVDRAARRLVFTGRTVHLVVLASPSMPNEDFRIAGMTNPTVVVPTRSQVRIEFINADSDMAHGLVISSGDAASRTAMMSAQPAFSGAALWFLGKATSGGMQARTFTFTASVPGAYRYLCPVPGHTEEGMVGRFVVSPAR